MLRLAGWLYRKITDFRNSLYDRGVLKSHDLGARTISIGNITAGGTGKTPLVAYVASLLAVAGEKVCILTRGYGRESSGRVLVSDGDTVLVDARTGGDEPVELAKKLSGRAIVLADADRVSAAKWAKEKFGVTTFVLDDAFQHRRVERQLDIVCIDATDPFGGDRVLPAGRLRESFANLSRAGAIVVTRSDLVESTDAIIKRIRRHNSNAPIFRSELRIENISTLGDFQRGAVSAGQTNLVKGAYAFCGLGNPESFLSQLERHGISVAGSMTLADHYRYRQSDVMKIEGEAAARNVEALVTTAKDAVKLKGLEFTMQCFVVNVDVVINDPDRFRDLVLSS